ncbi:DNA pilot protein [Apis mellifera associated microvirus 61]|nr:DNA pilot protein [Apis mellifera associated microvirus 61]
MDPFTASVIVGGAGALGSVFANQSNQQSVADQMRFQGYMSSTAHQREVADLRAAGLNPILSALGAGSSSPQGAAAQIQNPLEGISKGMETAIAVKQQKKDFEQKDAQISNTQQDTSNKIAQSGLINAQAISTAKDVEQKTLQTKLLKETLPHAIKKAKAEGDYSEVNQIMGIIGAGTSSAKDIKDTLNPLKGLIKIAPKK